jgi:hypothetical protein
LFVGTPHYGAPKAVLAFSQGESLFFDRPNDEVVWRNWARLLNWADVNLISGNLNRYGIHYPSSYQLLPIYETPRPNCLKPDFQADIEFGSSTGHFPAKYDIFDPGAWKDLGWPVQLKGKELDDFQKSELPGLLEQARIFLCDVAPAKWSLRRIRTRGQARPSSHPQSSARQYGGVGGYPAWRAYRT